MKQITGLVILGALFLLTACGKPAFEVADGSDVIQKSFQVEKTDTNLDFRNTYVIQMANQASVVVGSLIAHDIELTLSKDIHTYHLTGTYEILEKGNAKRIVSTKKFDLVGNSEGEHPDLSPSFDDAHQDERVRARLTCLSQQANGLCEKVILDLIVKKIGYKENMAAQFEIDLETKISIEQKPAMEEVETKSTLPQVSPQTETTLPPSTTTTTTVTPTPPPLEEDTRPATFEERWKGTPVPAPTVKPTPAQAPKQALTPAPKPTTAPAPQAPAKVEPTAPVVNEKPEKDEDEDPQAGLYVGTLYQDTDSLFEKKENKTETKAEPKKDPTPSVPAKKNPVQTAPNRPQAPAAPPAKPNTGSDQGRTRDQAIGSAAGGRLENATSLKAAIQSRQAPAVELLYPSRERFYGTWEIVDTIEKMSNFLSQKENLPGYIMAVGDISQRSGGPLVGSAHKSHQCGLDADISYPQSNIKSLAFNDLVTSGNVSSNLRLKETYQLFEYAQATLHNVDRIFVDPKIKIALCEMAQKQGMIASGRAVEVLRRLRPEDGHDNHFHLRIRCSPQQPRCRMMAEPPAGSGCDAVR